MCGDGVGVAIEGGIDGDLSTMKSKVLNEGILAWSTPTIYVWAKDRNQITFLEALNS